MTTPQDSNNDKFDEWYEDEHGTGSVEIESDVDEVEYDKYD